jgi:hypothetical protein
MWGGQALKRDMREESGWNRVHGDVFYGGVCDVWGDCQALERDMSEESGWKLVHGDVFRPPRHLELLAALVGTGVQLSLLVLVVVLIIIAGTALPRNQTVATIAGYTSCPIATCC